jgi:hypothetical protein
LDESPAEEIAQPPWSGDDHLRTLANGLQLRSLANAADDHRGANRCAHGHLDEGLVALDRELACGTQNDDPYAGMRFFISEEVDDGKDKGERLAGPGLGRGNHVASGQGRFDGLGLDGGWFLKAVLDQIALQESGEREFRETFHLYFCGGESTSRLPIRGEGVADQLPVTLSIPHCTRMWGGLRHNLQQSLERQII